MSEQFTTIRAKAFESEGVRTHRVMVDDDGAIRVWDSVAGYFTTCHCLSRAAQRQAVRKAAPTPDDSEYGSIRQRCPHLFA